MRLTQKEHDAFLKAHPNTFAAEALRQQMSPREQEPRRERKKKVTPVKAVRTRDEVEEVPERRTKRLKRLKPPKVYKRSTIRRGKMKYILYLWGFFWICNGQVIGGAILIAAAAYLTKPIE